MGQRATLSSRDHHWSGVRHLDRFAVAVLLNDGRLAEVGRKTIDMGGGGTIGHGGEPSWIRKLWPMTARTAFATATGSARQNGHRL
jgi:hypothetical protein